MDKYRTLETKSAVKLAQHVRFACSGLECLSSWAPKGATPFSAIEHRGALCTGRMSKHVSIICLILL